MRKIFQKIKKEYENARRKWGPGYFRLKRYFQYLEELPVEQDTILVESKMGRELEWNMIGLLKELCTNPRYQGYKIRLAVEPEVKEKRVKFLKKNGMMKVKTVRHEGEEYYRLLATAGYLLNDSEFPGVFIKRPEQTYLKLWDMTPIRSMGKHKRKGFGMIGNQQKNFLSADYAFFSNEFALHQIEQDYMLENVAATKVLIGGYPRNEVLFDEEKRKKIREKYGMDDRKNFLYFPVRRVQTEQMSQEEQCEQMIENLWALDKMLSDEQRVYVRAQEEVSRLVDWGGMSHVVKMPGGYSANEFLSAVDGLITDYSGVMLDYAALRRPIILFQYDKKEYMANNNFSVSFDAFPFPKAENLQELVPLLSREKNYDDTCFVEQFCPMEQQGAAEAICARFVFGEESPKLLEREFSDNSKKNVAIFGGDFRKNGITTSLVNLLEAVDREKYNFIILYKLDTLRRRQADLKILPEDVSYMGFYHVRCQSLRDTILCKLPFYPNKKKRLLLEKSARMDAHRVFGNCRIDKVIQFNGYVDDVILMFEQMPCSRTIYAHNDMNQEIRNKGNADRRVLSHAYRHYDSVAVVTPDLIPVAEKMAKSYSAADDARADIVVVKNIIDYKSVLRKSEAELSFDEETKMNMEKDKLQELLATSGKKYITVGRFSKEKGHFRLIEAFEKVYREHPDACLVILGGYGTLYQQTVKKAAASKAASRIAVIYYMSNPFPLIKQCDYFVLSSFYEGFGLVLAEADLLGLRCVSTDVVGPRLFMQQYNGYLVENSKKGILQGMKDCITGRVPGKLSVDYEQYNKEAVAQFESLLP